MADLWGGRFENGTDKGAFEFNASIRFDKRLYKEDIEGSLAHVGMLKKTGIIEDSDAEKIIEGLKSIYQDIESGNLIIDDSHEDIHSFVEAELIKRVGDPGKKLHTGRSRNDQVALDMKLYAREAVREIDRNILELQKVLFELMEANLGTYMPGFTHLQKAQPVTLAHHLGAYFEMLMRDRGRLRDLKSRMDSCPLGSGALAGTTFALDRQMTARDLHFTLGPTRNSMDSVSDRDYLLELMGALSIIMMHLSRFSEEIIIWNSNEYGFVDIDDGFSTGSSIMPQKKNPDIAELVRGKTGRVYGDLISLLTTMKGIPLAYDKDMQEDKEAAFDAIDTVSDCLKLFAGMMSTIRFNKAVMERSARRGFTNATDAADYLVEKGVPFRDAHRIIGSLVLKCEKEGKTLDELGLDEWRKESDRFESDIYDAISMEACVERRQTIGAPGMKPMREVMEYYRKYLEEPA